MGDTGLRGLLFLVTVARCGGVRLWVLVWELFCGLCLRGVVGGFELCLVGC